MTLIRLFLAIISVTSIAWPQMTDSTALSFAWLTDIHLGATTGEENLRTAVNDLKNEKIASFAIVSGDITEMDTDQYLSLAKTLLDSMDIPYYIIPGNHDTKWSSSGGSLFKQLWGADRFNIEIGEYRFIGLHQGPVLRMGNGYMNPDDIAWADSILQSLPDPRQKIFIVMHYPLNPSVDNWYALRDVIRPFNIQAVLHGHGHANKVRSFEGIPGIMSRSTLKRNDQPTGYTLVHLFPEQAEFYERIPDADSLHLWYTLPLIDRDTRDSLLLPMPDYSENDSSGVTITWQVSTGSIITSNPVIQGGKVFVSNTGGNILALDLTNGNQLWNWRGKGAIHSTPAIRGTRLVFGSVDSTITCLSTKNGKQKWQIMTSGPVLGSPLIHKNRVFIGSGDGVLRSLNLRNGRIKWEYSQIEGYIETRPVIAENRVMFGAWDGAFYALDKNQGTLLWKWSDGRPGPLYSPAACWPVVAQGKVFIVAPDRAMTAIKISNGETIWRKTGYKVREMIGISEDNNTIYARTMQDTVIAIQSSAQEFQLKWEIDAGFGYDFAPSIMVEKDGNVFFGTKNGRVYCLDSSNGAVLWHFRVSDGLVNAITPINANAVLTTAADGKVSLLSF